MQISLNGETYQCDSSSNISALLAELQLDAKKVAIERNLEVLPHSVYDSTVLCDGDEIEIVHFIGGG